VGVDDARFLRAPRTANTSVTRPNPRSAAPSAHNGSTVATGRWVPRTDSSEMVIIVASETALSALVTASIADASRRRSTGRRMRPRQTTNGGNSTRSERVAGAPPGRPAPSTYPVSLRTWGPS
jgi:hypothetical protein